MVDMHAEYIERGERRFHVTIIGLDYWQRHVEYLEWHYRIRECAPALVKYGKRDGRPYLVPRRLYRPSPYLPAPVVAYAPQVALYLAGEDIDTQLEREAALV